VSPQPLLRVWATRSGDDVVLHLDGELDCATAPEVAAAIEQLFTPPAARRVVVDAERLDFVDVAGLAPLLELARRLPPGGLRLLKPPRAALRLIPQLDLAEEFALDG
jgi:anti-sigma B factor antagonist